MRKAIRKVNHIVAAVGACFLVPLMLITTIDVISRDLFNRPIPGVVELSQYMLSVFILLGLAYAHHARTHVSVSVFTSRLSHRAQQALSLIMALAGVFIFSLLSWQGLIVGVQERTVSDMLRVPQYPFRLLVSVAAFLVCLEHLIDLGDLVRKIVRRSS